MIAIPVQHRTNRTPSIQQTRRFGFSLVELMVVISIIAVLVGLLLVALGRVRTAASITRTKNTMQQFAAACDQFQQEYGRYPGVIPEKVLAGLATPAPWAIGVYSRFSRRSRRGPHQWAVVSMVRERRA